MAHAWAWCIACIILVASAAEDDVLSLNEITFHDMIKTNSIMLVMFYAPWCGHCKQFAPEFAEAARQLKEATPPILLAKHDATAETKIAEKYGVSGYPTLKLFIDGQDQEYKGGRTARSIVTWVLKKAGPYAVKLNDYAALLQFHSRNEIGVVGFFDGSPHTTFAEAAFHVEDVFFAYSEDPAIAKKHGVETPAIHMFFPHDEEKAVFVGDISSVENIETFVKMYRNPMVTKFDGETAPELFGDGRPILILFREVGEKGDIAEVELRAAAPKLKRDVLITVAGSVEPMDQRLMDYVGVEPEEMPTMCFMAHPSTSMVKYRWEGPILVETVIEFMKQFKAGELTAYLKSEPVPESQSEPVHTLVGSTFQSVVMDNTKDVLVQFYAPWCGHCKKLEPIYKEVAKKLENVHTLVIAKMDPTLNDVENIEIQGFPTIKLWRADDKEPIDYDGDRDVESFIAWLEEKVTHRFGREDVKVEL